MHIIFTYKCTNAFCISQFCDNLRKMHKVSEATAGITTDNGGRVILKSPFTRMDKQTSKQIIQVFQLVRSKGKLAIILSHFIWIYL